MNDEDMQSLAKPEGLSPAGERAYDVIMLLLTKEGRSDTGGCKVFYSPEEWRQRGEKYGCNSELIIVHDGGDHAAFFNMDYERYALCDKMQAALNGVGVYVEGCTCWYSAIYLG